MSAFGMRCAVDGTELFIIKQEETDAIELAVRRWVDGFYLQLEIVIDPDTARMIATDITNIVGTWEQAK